MPPKRKWYVCMQKLCDNYIYVIQRNNDNSRQKNGALRKSKLLSIKKSQIQQGEHIILLNFVIFVVVSLWF